MKVTIYEVKFNPAECHGCRKWLVGGDRFIVVQEHPVLGKNYGPFVFHERCFASSHWNVGRIISASTCAPVCTWCSERVTKSPGGTLVEHDGDIWHKKCLERFMRSDKARAAPP